MTTEKAIEILSGFGSGFGIINRYFPKEAEALDMAIKALERASCIKEKCAYCPHCEHCDVDDETLAIKALEQRWIPCAERLPEDGDTYLVTIEYNGEAIGVDAASYSPVDGYIDKHWETFNDWKEDDDSCYHVTAWAPLPEPYKAESEDNKDGKV